MQTHTHTHTQSWPPSVWNARPFLAFSSSQSQTIPEHQPLGFPSPAYTQDFFTSFVCKYSARAVQTSTSASHLMQQSKPQQNRESLKTRAASTWRDQLLQCVAVQTLNATMTFLFPRKPQDELFLHKGMCLDSDEATLKPFTPRVFRCRASFTTACFEFVTVDLFVCFNRRLLDHRTRPGQGGRAGRPLLLRSGGFGLRRTTSPAYITFSHIFLKTCRKSLT